MQPFRFKIPDQGEGASHSLSETNHDQGEGASHSLSETNQDNISRKKYHCKIEKRRRDNINSYVKEISELVPACQNAGKSLDKASVLRITVQHVKEIKAAQTTNILSSDLPPSIVCPSDNTNLILDASPDVLVLAVDCVDGQLVFLSASVAKILHYEPSELLGRSLFDILHPDDVALVKAQLFVYDASKLPRMLVPGESSSRALVGARRSFFCRIKRNVPAPSLADENSYCVVKCQGYLKLRSQVEVIDLNKPGPSRDDGTDNMAREMTCFVAVAREVSELPPAPASGPESASNPAPTTTPTSSYLPIEPLVEIVTRLNIDGIYTIVDQSAPAILGYLPQDLVGRSVLEFVWEPQRGAVWRSFSEAVLRGALLRTAPFAMRRKDGAHVQVSTLFKPFRNPWTMNLDFVVAKTKIESGVEIPKKDDGEMQNLIRQDKEHEISSASVEQNMLNSAGPSSGELPCSLDNAAFSLQLLAPANDISYGEHSSQVYNDVLMSAVAETNSPAGAGGTWGEEVAGHAAGAAKENDEEMQNLIRQDKEHEISSASVEQNILNSAGPSSALPCSLDNAAFSLQLLAPANNISYGEYSSQVSNDVLISAVAETNSPAGTGGTWGEEVAGHAAGAAEGEGREGSDYPQAHPPGLIGDDEVDMAIIMSVLEAEAGLGGPTNLETLPWPLL